MRAVTSWFDHVPDRDGYKSVVWSLAFDPEGKQLIAAVGNRVLVYDPADGDLLHSLKGHKDSVYCVAYAANGKRFASGGADKTIIIWKNNAEGILKYTHNDPVQCLAYNPTSHQLASCTNTDFGLWSPEQKSVPKHKVPSRVLCCSWTNDGHFLALGLFNGTITIRDKNGGEKVVIERTAPIWSLSWNPSREEPFSVLSVCCWDQTLSFYQVNGIQVGKDKELNYDPCSVGYFSNGEYLCIGGSDRKVTLWTKEGVKLTTVGTLNDWVWSIAPRPKCNYVAVGCNDGKIYMYQLMFSTVHGLYQDRYAYRDFMTDVIIQHLMTEEKVRIKCRDYVKKIAVYRDRLAVQLPDRICIYELTHEDAEDMHYRVKQRIHKQLDCNLLVVTSLHIILCQERKLQLYNFQGARVREWVLDSVIRYIKVVGGPEGKEGLLVGLRSGLVLKIYIDNPFPIPLIQHNLSIRCLDLSMTRKYLAVVDENSNCVAYDLASKDQMFSEPNANSVAWNSELEDMLCFSGNGLLSIKTGGFPVSVQKLQGFVVGFKGSRIFCLHFVTMQTKEVPQSASLYRYIEVKDFERAYKIACLGVTDSDWKYLAMEALSNFNLEIARKAFLRVRDLRYIDLLDEVEKKRKKPLSNEQLLTAEIYAFQGRYQDAAKLYVQAGAVEKAIDMFSSLRQWSEARRIANASQTINVNELLQRQASWLEEIQDYRGAGHIHITVGNFDKGVSLLGRNGYTSDLVDVARKLPKTEVKTLTACAEFFRKNKQFLHAKEVYVKLGEPRNLIKLYVEFDKWDDAFMLLKSSPEGAEDVYLPYARWLVLQDRFDEAQNAFDRAGHPEESLRMLEQLSANAVIENRFGDAAYYYFLLSEECAKMIKNDLSEGHAEDIRYFQQMRRARDRSELYYAYNMVYKYTEEPFTSLLPESLFNICRFILVKIDKEREVPYGISKVYVLFALAKQAKNLGAFKMARWAYEKLNLLKIPQHWIDQIDLANVTIRSKPFTDKEELLHVCYRCSTTNALLNGNKVNDMCSNCYHPFVRSYCSFEHLPVVEFLPNEDISDEEAEKLIRMDPPLVKGPKQEVVQPGGGSNVLALDEDDEEEDMGEDAFNKQLLALVTGDRYTPLRIDRETLRSLDRNDVFMLKPVSEHLPCRFYRTMIPDVPIVQCHRCNCLFHEEDYEFIVLQKRKCPFCRVALDPTTLQPSTNE
uniref:Intraflagellar transport protein 122 homolog n=1 Tax=Palpitomonas bilix TaxID=652834 RepID=A0A7S3GCF1_9EUKA|mmetsp:Transcript_43368/g.112809  ORF Transcript_43368/g.112809 Transcript_43368/m.112809 type:complete len:1202 (+) Transcript_43368:139-3744(+)